MFDDRAELVHEMESIALQFEMWVHSKLPKDGSGDDVFEDWREAYYSALDNPDDEAATRRAIAHFAELEWYLLGGNRITPTPGRPQKL